MHDDVAAPVSVINRGNAFRLPLPERLDVRPIVPQLGFSGGLTHSSDGILYFANHLHLGTIGRFVVGNQKSPETFIDLNKWMTSYGDRTPWAHGMRIDDEGHLVVAEAGTGKVIRISSGAKKIEVLADSYDGTLLSPVFDVAIGREGEVFASAPSAGVIYGIRPEDGFIRILNEELIRAHGLAISLDETKMVAAEPDSGRVLVFDLKESRQTKSMSIFADFSPFGQEPAALAFDEFGRLFVGLGDAAKIQVFDFARGILLRTYDLAGPVTALSYADGILYVSGGQEVRSIHLR